MKGGVCGEGGCMGKGACVAKGEHVWYARHHPLYEIWPVNMWAVHILLECILVLACAVQPRGIHEWDTTEL